MSVQMVLLPVFVLIGLAFALLFWTASARTRVLVTGGEDEHQGYRAASAELAGARHPDRQLLQ